MSHSAEERAELEKALDDFEELVIKDAGPSARDNCRARIRALVRSPSVDETGIVAQEIFDAYNAKHEDLDSRLLELPVFQNGRWEGIATIGSALCRIELKATPVIRATPSTEPPAADVAGETKIESRCGHCGKPYSEHIEEAEGPEDDCVYVDGSKSPSQSIRVDSGGICNAAQGVVSAFYGGAHEASLANYIAALRAALSDG